MKLLAGLRLERGSKAVLALIGVIAIVAPVLALLRGLIPLPLIPAILAASWVAAYFLVERILSIALEGALHLMGEAGEALTPGVDARLPDPLQLPEPSLPGVDSEVPGDSEEGDIGEAALLAWGFLASLVEEVTGHRSTVYVAVHDDGVVYYVYPETYGDDVYKLVDDDATGDITVARAGDRKYLVVLDEAILEDIYEMALEGSGEKLLIRSLEQLELVYRIARETARSHLAGATETYLDYVAYKALVKLNMKGSLDIPDRLLDELPSLDTDTRNRIKKQVDEELRALGPHRAGAASA